MSVYSDLGGYGEQVEGEELEAEDPARKESASTQQSYPSRGFNSGLGHNFSSA